MANLKIEAVTTLYIENLDIGKHIKQSGNYQVEYEEEFMKRLSAFTGCTIKKENYGSFIIVNIPDYCVDAFIEQSVLQILRETNNANTKKLDLKKSWRLLAIHWYNKIKNKIQIN